jgi:DNA-binding GntR family transcriptional regulator
MEQFRVSQTPIRDALLKLAEEKLVDIFAQHSTVVSSIDVSQAKQAHFLRQAVELEVVRRLCAVEDRGFVRPIEDELQRQKDALQRGDIVDLRERDLTFHHRLCVAAGVPDLWRLISSRSGHMDRLRQLCLPAPAQGLGDHWDILMAIKARDTEEAERVLRKHLTRTLEHVGEIQKKHPDYFR